MIKNMNNSVSIIIPALNEAGNIEKTIQNVLLALENQELSDYEIIIINDGSTDETGKIAAGLSINNERIKVMSNPKPKGLGYNIRIGIRAAVKDYVGWFPGDNQIILESIQKIFEQIGKTDAIIPYVANPKQRTFFRLMLSRSYTMTFNVLFGLHLKYFNGPCFFRRDALKDIVMTTDSPAYMAEILVQLVKKKTPYVEVPFCNQERVYGKSSVIKWKNVFLIGKTIINLARII